jgi:hypothetical protein
MPRAEISAPMTIASAADLPWTSARYFAFASSLRPPACVMLSSRERKPSFSLTLSTSAPCPDRTCDRSRQTRDDQLTDVQKTFCASSLRALAAS